MKRLAEVSSAISIVQVLLLVFVVMVDYVFKADGSFLGIGSIIASQLFIVFELVNLGLLAVLLFARQKTLLPYALAILVILLVWGVFFLPPVYSSPL